MILTGLAFASFSQILSVPSIDTPGNTMVLTVLIKFPIIFMTPLFIAVYSSPIAFISPISYFVDMVNIGLGDVSAFGAFGLLLDFGFMLAFGVGFLLLAFYLHEKTLERRFQ
jgi:ABC-2 type transport system permease protein